MKCLSIHQPWAFSILNQGKDVENRIWPTKHRGPLLIHAAKSRKSYDAWMPESWHRFYQCDLPPWESFAKGAIVGVVDVVDCFHIFREPIKQQKYQKWSQGPYCWVLSNPRAFEVPIPYKGNQNLFNVDDSLVSHLIRG